MCKAIDKNSVCCLPTYPRKLAFWLLLSEFWAGSFRFFFTWIIGGRVRQRCTLAGFQCLGRTVLAVGAGGSCFDYHLSLFLSFHYRLKYCLKGKLKAKQQLQFTVTV